MRTKLGAPVRADVPMLTVAAAARLLNLSTQTIRRRIKDGQLPVYRPGKSIKIAPEDLKIFLARCRTFGT